MCVGKQQATVGIDTRVPGSAERAKHPFNWQAPATFPTPDLTDKAVREAQGAQLLRLLKSGGRRSTFLTGPSALTTGAVQRPTLLGG